MADNVTTTTTVSTLPNATVIAARSVTYSGDTSSLIAPVGLVAFSGSDDAKTATDIPGDAGNGLDVDVTRVGGNVATTVADGADVTLGAKADAAATTDAGTFTLMSLFKRLLEKFTTQFPAALSNGFFKVSVQETGVTQPVSDASGSLTIDNAALSVTGGGVEASALRVTIANDSTGLVSIDDNGGSVTVDGTVAVSGTVTVGSHAVTNAGTFATQESGALLTAAQLIDDTVATLGTTTYTETTTKGNIVGAVRRDADTTLVDTTNEIGPLQMDANGRLKVEAFSGETLPVSLTSTTITGTVAVTQSGTWDEVGINDSGNSITVDAASLPLPTGASTLAEQQTQTTALQLIDNVVLVEDAAAAGGESGVQVLGVRKDSAGTLASTDGDFTPFQMDSLGNVRVNVAAGGAGDGSILDGVSSSIKATVLDYTSSNPLAVRLTDTGGDYVGAGAGTQYTVDAVAPAAPVGTALVAERDDQLATLTEVEGDWTNARATSKGALWVAIPDTNGDPITSFGGGTQYTEDAVAAADPVGTALNLVRLDTPAAIAADGDNVTARGNSAGAQYVELLSGTAKVGGDATNGLDVDVTRVSGTVTIAGAVTNAGTFVVQENGAALTALQLIDDTIATLGTTTYTEAATKGSIIGAVRRDADTTLVDTTNEVGPLQMDANGRLKVEAFSGETLPVSLTSTTVTGTVAVTQSGTWDEVGINDSGNSITVDAPVGTPAFVRLSDGAAAITTLAVSLASVPSHAVTNAGTFAVQVDGSALTALQLIDDTIATLGTTTYTEAATKGSIIGAVRRDADTTLVDTTNEVGPLQMDANGRLKVEVFSGEALPVTLTSTTVTGTVAVTQSGTWDEVGINDSGNSITVDNGGTFATQESGALLTAAQLIDDTVYAEDVAAQAADKGIAVLAVRRDADTTLVGTDNDYANLQVDANGYLKVEIFDGGGSHTVDNAGTFAVQVDGSALTALQLIDNPILVDDAAFTPATSSVSMAGFQADEASTDSVDEGDAGAARMTLDRKLITTPQPHTAGGLTIFRSIDLDEGTLEVVKASPGCIYGMWITNTATATRWIKFYDATSGTVGTGTPVITFGIPGNTSDDIAGLTAGTHGIMFATGICVGASTGVADADTGAPGANDVIINLFYK